MRRDDSAKYGRDQERRAFVELHAMVGDKTNVITAALVEATLPHFDVEPVAADKAYGSLSNLELLDAHG